jgi:hypothetical protein
MYTASEAMEMDDYCDMLLESETHIIFDYTDAFAGACDEEVRLYAQGLLNMNKSLYGVRRSFGVERRPGVVFIKRAVYKAAVAEFRRQCFVPQCVINMEKRFWGAVRLVERQQEGRDRGYGSLWYRSVARLMSYHVFNWFLPFGAFERQLVGMLGVRDGKEAYQSLFTSRVGSHVEMAKHDDMAHYAGSSNLRSIAMSMGNSQTSLGYIMTKCPREDYSSLMAIVHMAAFAATEEEVRRHIQLRIFNK